MKPKVDVFFYKGCPLCHKAIMWFTERAIDFTAYAVDWDGEKFVDSENTREMFRRIGHKVDIVPQMFIGKTHIAGWRTLEPMIQSGEADKVLKRAGLLS